MATRKADLARSELYVVGVGASAGGLEALERFFDAFAPDGRFAFVVVQHLSPDFRSVMDELLARHTTLSVRRAEDGMAVEPDGLYLLPARLDMTIQDGRLRLRERAADAGLSLPIDLFLGSLAEDQGANAIGVVLSGTGSDGSRGIRAIHERGGLVLAQTEASAKFDGMPRAAADTGVVDLVLTPEEMPRALVAWADQREEKDGDAGPAPRAMDRIFELLKRESGIDFSGYKPSTVQRRIDRRLLLSDSAGLDAYLGRIESDPAELRSLYRDLLIGVTRFFRDGDAFARLSEEIVPEIVDALPEGAEARVWVPACATGEEAYSLGILFHEAFRARRRPPAVRLFATDVHRASLEVASAGEYPDDVVKNVPPDLRERYFVAKGSRFQVASDLRGTVVFAHHNLLRDAPFTRLDLVSCRNFLIYLQPAAQNRVIALLHFALKKNGVMFLGPSESPGPYADELPAIDMRWKLYRKLHDVRLAPDLSVSAMGVREPPTRPARARTDEDARVRAAREGLLTRYAPPSLLVDAELRLLHAFNGGGRFLAQRDGQPTLHLLDLLEGELKFVVGGTLKRVMKDGQPVTFGGVEIGGERYRVTVMQLGDAVRAAEGYLVSFEAEKVEPRPTPPTADVSALARERVQGLELELRYAKENLQATIEEMETSNEELQATNEELIASNEELQSTNEELHSVNEELYTVNAEYQAKIAELTELTADVNHLLEATEVHTLFTDRDLRLRKFTPRIGELFDLLPQDVGRRVDAFSHGLLDDAVFADLASVVATGARIERDVRDRHGREFFLRILPYRPNGGDVEGAVLTLVDISALKRAQEELATSEERYRVLVRSFSALLWTSDPSGALVEPQPEWAAHTGQDLEQARGFGWLDAFHPADRAALLEAWRANLRSAEPFERQARLWGARGRAYRTFAVHAVPRRGADGAVVEWLWNLADVHDRAVAEEHLQRAEERLRGILENAPSLVWIKDAAGRYVLASRTATAIIGGGADLLGKTDHDVLDPEHADRVRAVERRVLTSGEIDRSEDELGPADDRRTYLTVRFPLRDRAGRVQGLAAIATDISERKAEAEQDRKAIEARDRFMAMLSHELRTPLGAILNASELLERAAGNAERRARAQEIIHRQSRQMARLIDDLLDVSRVTREKMPLKLEPVDLTAVLRDAVEAQRPAIEAKGLALGVEIPRGPIRLVGDAVRLTQAFNNLLSNAVRYTPTGRIDVAMILEPGRAVVRVRDTGIGMTPEQAHRIFELYYQAPQGPDRAFGGLGVGLTLAQTLLQLHGGGVRASSPGPGQGSEFVATLPVPPEDVEPVETPAPRRRLRIVLVEDNEDIRDTLKDLLELEGHDVSVCADGVTGVERIGKERPDLAFVDVGLPQLDGHGVARKIRASLGRTVTLIALTGYGSNQDRAAAIEAGFDDHLVKPVEAHRLLRVIDQVVAE